MSIGKEEEAGWRRAELASTGMDQPASGFPKGRVLKNPLHNFSFLTKSWGRHRIFRCVNSVPGTGFSGTELTTKEAQRDNRSEKHHSPSQENLKKSSPPGGGSSGKEVEEGGGEEASASAVAAAALAEAKPWNLRTRRAACIAPVVNGRNRYPNFLPSRRQYQKDNLGKANQMVLEVGGQQERRKFSVSLSYKEIEEDFYVFKRMKPPRRPQKRARIVQRQLDELFPGLWLEEVTLDTYKTEELR